MTRSVSDDGLIPEDFARSEIVDTANNLEIVTMYSFASKKNVRKLVLFLILRMGFACNWGMSKSAVSEKYTLLRSSRAA